MAFTDVDLHNADRYAILATEQEKYKLAKAAHPKFMSVIVIKNKGRDGWKHKVFLENEQHVSNFLEISVDPDQLDCEAVSCHPNDPKKLGRDLKGQETVACDFWKSKEVSVRSGDVTFNACQSACFEMDMEIDKDSGNPVPRGNTFIHKNGEPLCRAVNQQLLIYATVPTSRHSDKGRVEGYNTPEIPPYEITDDTYSRFEITYAYCNYFLKSFDEKEKDCYTSFGSQISEFLVGRAITNFFFQQDKKALKESATKITPTGAAPSEKVNFFKENANVGDKENIFAMCGKMTTAFMDVITKAHIMDVDEAELKFMFLQELNDGSSVETEEHLKPWLNTFFHFRQLVLNKLGGGSCGEKTSFLQPTKNDSRGQSKGARQQHDFPLYSINLIEVSNFEGGGSAGDLRHIHHKPKSSGSPMFLEQIKSIGMMIWMDTVDLFTGQEIEWQHNFVTNIAADAILSKALSKGAKASQKIVQQLSAETIQGISSRAARYGAKVGTKLMAKGIIKTATRSVVRTVIRVAVKVALQMLKLLARLATLAFNVLSIAIGVLAIASFILDLIFQQQWLDEMRSKADLQNHIDAYRETFRENMNLVNSETAPFAPKDIIDYFVDAQMRNHAGFKSTFQETEDEMYMRHYYDYLNGRTVNSLGQPVFASEIVAEVDSEAQIKKVMKDINEIFAAGSVYCRAINYNSARIPFLATSQHEERNLNDKIGRQNDALRSRSAQNILGGMSFTAVGLIAALTVAAASFRFFQVAVACTLFLLCVFFQLLLYLLVVLHQIENNYTEFLSNTMLFNFDRTQDLDEKGVLTRNEIQEKIGKFNADFIQPFNEEISMHY